MSEIINHDVQIIGDGQSQGIEISVNGVMEAYRHGSTIAIHASTWRLSPKLTRNHPKIVEEYDKNPLIAERDYGAIAPRSVEAAERDPEGLSMLAVRRESPFTETGSMKDWFVPDPRFEYYLHADLSKVRDDTGLSMCHYDADTGKVFVDFIYTLRNFENWHLSFSRVEEYIVQLHNKGFRLSCSFDGWNSAYLMERLINMGVPAQLYSVDRGLQAYDTLISAIHSGQVDFPYNGQFLIEMKGLLLIDGKKYDHRKGSNKDTADAVAGCVSRCYLSILGSLLSATEIENVVQPSGMLDVVWDDDRASFVFIGTPTTTRTRFGLRIDAVEDQLIVQVGHQDRETKVLWIDGFYVWDEWTTRDAGCEGVLHFLDALRQGVVIYAASLNRSVPYEISQWLQTSGIRFTTELAAKRGQSGQLIRTMAISRQAINMTVQQIKKGSIRVPEVEALVRDLSYLTETNAMQRVFVKALAGFVDFAEKQHVVGTEARPMPAAISTRMTPGMPLGPPRMPTAGVYGGNEDVIDRVRKRAGYVGSTGNALTAQPGKRTFPKPLRG